MKDNNAMKTFFVIVAIILVAAFINSCTAQPVRETAARISLSWENTSAPHPERAPWSNELTNEIKADMAIFGNAKDVTEICPKFKSLNLDDQTKALGEFWVAVAYHESSYNPASNAVDVGKPGDKGSWSVGLFQMSGNDSAAKKFGYGFEELKNPINNIQVALEQMKRQITKTGLYLLPNSSPQRYWATLLVGNKYSQISDIKARVIKYMPECK